MIRQLHDTPALIWWCAAALIGQGLAVMMPFLLLRRLLTGAPAELRHRIALGTLLVVTLAFPITLIVGLQQLTPWLATGIPSAAAGSRTINIFDNIAVFLPWLPALWLTGTLIGLARIGLGAWRLRALIRATSPAPLDLHPSPLTIARAGLDSAPRVLVSHRIAGPFVAGLRHEVLVLPAGLERALSPSEREAVILHELMHLRRHDYALNLAQHLIQAVFWFQPAVWLLGAELDQVREECCDDAVIRAVGRPAALARALVRLEELQAGTRILALAGAGGSLATRVQRLVAHGASGSTAPVPAWSALAILTLVGVGAAGIGGAWAAALTSRGVPVVTIFARDPAGPFTLEMAGGVLRGMHVAGASVASDRLAQHGRTVRLVDPRGRTQLDIEIVSPAGIRWTPRPMAIP
ncbi:MAG: M56 family metallopeptidase [Gemmatimonadota bacterium]